MEYGPNASLCSICTNRLPRQVGAPERLTGHPHLLFVGKLCAHKNQALLLRTLAALRQTPEGARAELSLIGREDPIYGKYLRALRRALNLENVAHFLGKVSDFELAAKYLEADYFVSPSLHEGFCIP
ncbi:MAG: glycosyltransferase [Bdellovibrionota bacterium]